MKYKGYELDTFQEEALQAIERKHTVIVAAPTGAGKTLIAEYAIEKYLQEQRCIIYTAPIKALSNQKFRDFGADYGDKVGIVTGDVCINPSAPVLLMTTEIFRNTVFDDPERLREVEYVIFDEIHYLNDEQRGTVWEESILFAPPHIDFICLSATIPNLEEFAGWMQEVRPHTVVEVINETHRPVPLKHHLYLRGYGLGTLKDLRRLHQRWARQWKKHPRFPEEWGEEEAPEEVLDLLTHIEKSGQLPCLYFCFSRRACEEKATYHGRRELLSRAERREILALYDRLRERFGLTSDRNAWELRRLIARGVAYHHAGMLPTLKEVVERLFTSGRLKLLFTTETFALGVNMPACSVVFDSLEKFDGFEFRYLKTREYHQMAGRAGRRGIDPIGYVYARVDPLLDKVEEVERILTDEVEPTESQFKLSYSSLLSLYRRYGEGLYEVCVRSFNNYQNVRRLHQLEQQLAALGRKREQLPPIDCFRKAPEKIHEYASLVEELRQEREATREGRQFIRRHFRGKRKRALRQRLLQQLNAGAAQIERRLTQLPCFGCPRLSQCLQRQRLRRQHARQMALLQQEMDLARNYQREQISLRLRLLREFGYLDQKGLTSKGQVAADIYGYEIQVAELLFADFFHELRETDINILMAAVVFESKRTESYAKIRPKRLRRLLDRAQQVLSAVEEYERQLGIDHQLKPLDPSLTLAVQAWSEGCAFEDLAAYTTTPDGDLVRAFRHTIDLLRQLRRTLEGDYHLQDKITACIARLNRDVVDAERQLRISERLAEEEHAATRSP
ncbi:MAG TPA: DEAD/DEAH box helicase [Armatimonadetes bacterium]|nr:DEAD/DEAH box helicase [Armatimonadota bacterium]